MTRTAKPDSYPGTGPDTLSPRGSEVISYAPLWDQTLASFHFPSHSRGTSCSFYCPGEGPPPGCPSLPPSCPGSMRTRRGWRRGSREGNRRLTGALGFFTSFFSCSTSIFKSSFSLSSWAILPWRDQVLERIPQLGLQIPWAPPAPSSVLPTPQLLPSSLLTVYSHHSP